MDDLTWLFLACAAVTYLTRCGRHVILSRFGTIHHRVSAALDAVPTAVMAALVAPSLVTHGPAEVLAILVSGLIALRAPLMFSVAVSMVVLVGLRTLI
ncbi:MAG: AzlD family protein [Rhizobiaceae bacterium]|nr:AzlD family protein [Rhizobiaceae bacterium]